MFKIKDIPKDQIEELYLIGEALSKLKYEDQRTYLFKAGKDKSIQIFVSEYLSKADITLYELANNLTNLITGSTDTKIKSAISVLLLIVYANIEANELEKREFIEQENKKLLEREKELKDREKALEKKEKSEKKRGKYKRSGHLQDQLLKYTYPKDNTPDLFSVLTDETKGVIEDRGVERSQIVEGIKLSPAETKIIDTLCKLLHHSSQNLEPKKDLYYTGNKDAEIITYREERLIAPKLGLTLYDLTKEYIGIDKKVGGKDIENVSNILKGLSTKDFLIRYKEEVKQKGGGKIIRELEVFNKIISLPTFRERVYNKEEIEISKTEETLIVLHPIFRSQIDSKFIVYPDDITQRTILAYGSPNVSQITLNLREYLMRELSSKHYNPEIGQERLYYLLAEKWMRESRKSKVKEYTEKALQVVKDIGLLESYKIEIAKITGEPKYVFKLNRDFE
jgi:hypothetical protein